MRFYHTSSEPQYKTGGRYHGEWKENMKHGYGTRSWVNGNKYEGVRKYEKVPTTLKVVGALGFSAEACPLGCTSCPARAGARRGAM